MTTQTDTILTIKDLPAVEEIDEKGMVAVRGGMTYGQAFQMLQDAASGKCDFSETGKSYVCY
ncbi:hypothetical protein G3N57_07680 [Paraburkholderia sp. Se-20369]|nr:hypothetical protein [Paraburkholderia sp. Se-20369]TCW85591.1 hypothetical protein C5O80_10470 [Burkholderia sp. SRS-46]